jgi:hypothetical protein
MLGCRDATRNRAAAALTNIARVFRGGSASNDRARLCYTRATDILLTIGRSGRCKASSSRLLTGDALTGRQRLFPVNRKDFGPQALEYTA